MEVEVGGEEGEDAEDVTEVFAEAPAGDVVHHDAVEVAVLKVGGEGAHGLHEAKHFDGGDGAVPREGYVDGAFEDAFLIGVEGEGGGSVGVRGR